MVRTSRHGAAMRSQSAAWVGYRRASAVRQLDGTPRRGAGGREQRQGECKDPATTGSGRSTSRHGWVVRQSVAIDRDGVARR